MLNEIETALIRVSYSTKWTRTRANEQNKPTEPQVMFLINNSGTDYFKLPLGPTNAVSIDVAEVA
jgi:hypothetical protein